MSNMRIMDHAILGPLQLRKKIHVTFDGETIEALEGEPIAASLIAAGKKVFYRTVKKNDPRGYFCAIGVCNDCKMIVNGVPNVRTCVTPVSEGMIIETQIGKGALEKGE